MVDKCDNCGTQLVGIQRMTMCGCSGRFCSQKCSEEWHKIEPRFRPKEGKVIK